MDETVSMFNLVIRHVSCWTAYTYGDYHDSLIFRENRKDILRAVRYVYYGGNIKQFINGIRNKCKFKNLTISGTDMKKTYLLSMSVPYYGSIIEKVSIPGINVVNAEVSDGTESYYLMALHETIKELRKNIIGDNNIKILQLKQLNESDMIRHLSPGTLYNILSPAESRILDICLSRGFFNTPREVNMQGIADIAGISKARISTILRNTENKIFTLIGRAR
jgi:predicted DNA binding protein